MGALLWTGRAWGPSESSSDIFQYTWEPFGIFTQQRLERTIASCSVQYASQDVPPERFQGGNGALFFRVIMTNLADDPPSGWPADPNVGDDILMAPIVWRVGVYQPANLTSGRTENLWYQGSLDPAQVDVKSRRLGHVIAGTRIHVFVGPLGGRLDSGPATDQFTTAITLRMLWETGV